MPRRILCACQYSSVRVYEHTVMILFGSWTVDFLVAVVILLTITYYWWTSQYDYWKKRNVPFTEPSFPFGNMAQSTGKINFPKMCDDVYSQFKSHGFGGVFMVRARVLVVCNPDIIKQVLTKDFNAFQDRGVPCEEEHDPFSANLFNLSGERWRTIRAKLSPTFTSGKIKKMFPLIHECTQDLKDCVQESLHNNSSVEMKDLLYRFTTDVIGTCAFGINCNSLKDPCSKFHLMGRELVSTSFLNNLRFIAFFLWPKSARYLTFKRTFPKAIEFFSKLMSSTVEHRRKTKAERNDFVQLMMQLLEDDSKSFSQDLMTAQALQFFLAGLDNVANTIGFSLHAMAVNQELQERVHQEVQSVLQEFDGNNCYEAVTKMDLLSRVIDESLRMYTPNITGIIRKLNADEYTVPGTDVVIQKGTMIMIPTPAIMYDEEYFPNPHKFDPDRFTEEERTKRHPFVYLPFGDGPRVCIGVRFAQLEMRLCLSEMLRHFHFSIASETDLGLELDPGVFIPTPRRGFWFRVSSRNAK